eukprot:Anaeramoba_ignava/c17854_g1_i1.p2 GENE.c17854_g1_i1~~c17854_g1_i1.p2  ORF type:complete len:282 (+),score=113.30 c17854_g1_i1:1168-2013(+)
MEESIATVEKHKQEIKKKTWDLEINVSNKMDELEKLLSEYHQSAMTLRLIPSGAKNNTDGINYQLSINRDYNSNQVSLKDIDDSTEHTFSKQNQNSLQNGISLLSDNLPQIKQGLTNLAEYFNRNSQQIQNDITQLREKQNHLDSQINEKKTHIFQLQNENDKNEQQYNKFKEELFFYHQELENQQKALQDEISQIQKDGSSRILQKQNQLQSLTDEFNRFIQKSQEEQSIWQKDLFPILEDLTNLKLYISKQLKDLQNYAQQIFDQAKLDSEFNSKMNLN